MQIKQKNSPHLFFSKEEEVDLLISTEKDPPGEQQLETAANTP